MRADVARHVHVIEALAHRPALQEEATTRALCRLAREAADTGDVAKGKLYLEALNTLYPDCDRMVTEPVCYKSNYNIGWVRLGIWTLCPVLLIMIMQLIVATNLQNYQTKLYEEMKTAAAVLNETLTEKEKEVEKKNRQMTRLKKQSVHEKAKAVQDEREKNTAKNVARKLGAWQKKSTAEPFHSVSATSAAVTSVDAV